MIRIRERVEHHRTNISKSDYYRFNHNCAIDVKPSSGCDIGIDFKFYGLFDYTVHPLIDEKGKASDFLVRADGNHKDIGTVIMELQRDDKEVNIVEWK